MFYPVTSHTHHTSGIQRRKSVWERTVSQALHCAWSVLLQWPFAEMHKSSKEIISTGQIVKRLNNLRIIYLIPATASWKGIRHSIIFSNEDLLGYRKCTCPVPEEIYSWKPEQMWGRENKQQQNAIFLKKINEWDMPLPGCIPTPKSTFFCWKSYSKK